MVCRTGLRSEYFHRTEPANTMGSAIVLFHQRSAWNAMVLTKFLDLLFYPFKSLSSPEPSCRLSRFRGGLNFVELPIHDCGISISKPKGRQGFRIDRSARRLLIPSSSIDYVRMHWLLCLPVLLQAAWELFTWSLNEDGNDIIEITGRHHDSGRPESNPLFQL